MTPQELAALSRINNEMKHLVRAVDNLTKTLERVGANVVTSFRGFYERPLPPLAEVEPTCTCGHDRIKYPHVGHHIDCPILKGEHSPDDACIPTVGHKDKENQGASGEHTAGGEGSDLIP